MKKPVFPAELARCRREGDHFYFCISKAQNLDATVAALVERMGDNDYRYDATAREWCIPLRHATVLEELFVNFPKILRGQSGAVMPIGTSPYSRSVDASFFGFGRAQNTRTQNFNQNPQQASQTKVSPNWLTLLTWLAIGILFVALLPWLTEGTTPSLATLINQQSAVSSEPTATVAIAAAPVESAIQAAPAATRTPRPTPTPRSAQGTVFQTANLRSGPGTDYEVRQQLQGGETVNVIGQVLVPGSFSWYQLDSGLWIYSQLVSGPSTEVPVVEVPSTEAEESP